MTGKEEKEALTIKIRLTHKGEKPVEWGTSFLLVDVCLSTFLRRVIASRGLLSTLAGCGRGVCLDSNSSCEMLKPFQSCVAKGCDVDEE